MNTERPNLRVRCKDASGSVLRFESSAATGGVKRAATGSGLIANARICACVEKPRVPVPDSAGWSPERGCQKLGGFDDCPSGT